MPVGLCINPLISSPMLIGFIHPCIVLPDADISDTDFQYTVQHEMIHYRRKDMFYKWLVQAVVCLHWFNPLVYLMSREIDKACEFSCDEALIAGLIPAALRLMERLCWMPWLNQVIIRNLLHQSH